MSNFHHQKRKRSPNTPNQIDEKVIVAPKLDVVHRDVIVDVIAPKLDVISLSRLCCTCRRFNTLLGRRCVLVEWRQRVIDGSVGACMREAVRQSEVALVHVFVAKGADCFSNGLWNAATVGNMELINFFLGKNAGVNSGLSGASILGSIDLIDFFLAKGADDLYEAVGNAASRGHLDAVKHLVENGAGWMVAMYVSIQYGHMNVLKYWCTLARLDELDIALKEAAFHNEVEMISLLIQKGATDLSNALIQAVYGNRIESARLLIECGAHNIHQALDEAEQYFVNDESYAGIKFLKDYLHNKKETNFGQ